MPIEMYLLKISLKKQVHLKNKIFPQKTKSENPPLQEIAVNTTLMTNVGTINVDGFGPVNIVTGGPNNVQVRLNFVEVKT